MNYRLFIVFIIALSMAFPASASDADNWFFNARLHIEDGRKDKAIECLKKVLELEPGYSKARKLLEELGGNVDSVPAKSSKPSSKKRSTRTSSSGSKNIRNLLKSANKNAVSGNYLDAIPDYKSVLKLDPKQFSARLNLGYCYEKTGNYFEAIKQYKRILVLDNKNALAHNNLGFLYAHINDDIDSALEHCNRAVELDSGNSNYLDSLGYVYLKKKLYDRADEYFDKAIKKDSKNTSALRHKGMTQYLRGNIEKAVNVYQDCLDKKKEADTYLQLATIYVDTGQAEEALKNLGLCIEKSPDNLEALFYLGFLYLSMGDSRSEDFFKKVVKINPDSAEAFMARALPLAMKNAGTDDSRLEKIDDLLSKAIEKRSSWWMPYFFLATNCIESKDKEKALEVIKKCREIAPSTALSKMDGLEEQANSIVSGKLYENSANSFSVYYPASWSMTEDTAQMNLAQAQVVFSKKEETAIVAVIIQPNTSGYNLNTIVEYKRANLSAYQPGYKEIEVKDVSFPNFTGAMIVYTQQGNSQIAQVFATIDKRILAIAYIDTEDNFKKNFPDFESILKTFRLNY
jgi:tetratricopeptide (TPR) repeat protein